MKTAKIFKNGRSQAVRLPVEFRFDGSEVYIKKTDEGVLLISKKPSLKDIYAKKLWTSRKSFSVEREQPIKQQVRKGLDDLFT